MLGGSRGQLVVTSPVFGLVPDGIELEPRAFAELRLELAPAPAGTPVDLRHWRPSVVRPVDLRVGERHVEVGALALLEEAVAGSAALAPASALDPSRQRADAAVLAESALRSTPLTDTLLRLIGAGPGSTPAGDDVVAGVLAGLHATGRVAAALELGRAVVPLLPRTTSASALYLRAAADGRFAERAHLLVAGLGDPLAARTAIRAAAGYGATSGADMLAGVVAAARVAARASTRAAVPSASPRTATRKSA